jgi:hypothetical protein
MTTESNNYPNDIFNSGFGNSVKWLRDTTDGFTEVAKKQFESSRLAFKNLQEEAFQFNRNNFNQTLNWTESLISSSRKNHTDLFESIKDVLKKNPEHSSLFITQLNMIEQFNKQLFTAAENQVEFMRSNVLPTIESSIKKFGTSADSSRNFVTGYNETFTRSWLSLLNSGNDWLKEINKNTESLGQNNLRFWSGFFSSQSENGQVKENSSAPLKKSPPEDKRVKESVA